MEKINALTPLKVSMNGADNGNVFFILARPLQLYPLTPDLTSGGQQYLKQPAKKTKFSGRVTLTVLTFYWRAGSAADSGH